MGKYSDELLGGSKATATPGAVQQPAPKPAASMPKYSEALLSPKKSAAPTTTAPIVNPPHQLTNPEPSSAWDQQMTAQHTAMQQDPMQAMQTLSQAPATRAVAGAEAFGGVGADVSAAAGNTVREAATGVKTVSSAAARHILWPAMVTGGLAYAAKQAGLPVSKILHLFGITDANGSINVDGENYDVTHILANGHLRIHDPKTGRTGTLIPPSGPSPQPANQLGAPGMKGAGRGRH